MAYQAAQVARRCCDASEDDRKHLGCGEIFKFKRLNNESFPFSIPDLSECSLIQVPDAVYHLMRHTELKSCDLSGNVITKIPPKFAVKFNLITGTRVSMLEIFL